MTRAFVDAVRGVDSNYAVNSLIDKELIGAVGRLEAPGRPMLYGTTDKFLRVFGLSSLSDLPETETMLPAGKAGEQLSIAVEGKEGSGEGDTEGSASGTAPAEGAGSAPEPTESTANTAEPTEGGDPQ